MLNSITNFLKNYSMSIIMGAIISLAVMGMLNIQFSQLYCVIMCPIIFYVIFTTLLIVASKPNTKGITVANSLIGGGLGCSYIIALFLCIG